MGYHCAVILLACSLGHAAAVSKAFLSVDALPTFDAFAKLHGRDYQARSTEYAHRKDIYERRLEVIREQNANPDRLWNAGVNHLSDHTDDEFRARLGWRHGRHSKRSSIGASLLELGAAPFRVEEKDYMNLTVASDVPDQGGCGSCWAVASAELMKAHDEIHNGKARVFSAQELVSCVKNPRKCGGAGGCEGATVELAMDYIMNNGLRTTSEVPYQGTTGECDKKTVDSKLGEIDSDGRILFAMGSKAKTAGKTAAKANSFVQGHGLGLGGQALGLLGFYTIEKNKYEPLMRALLEVGPVGITVAASDWSTYSTGVFDKCTDVTLNHAVVLMGAGKEGLHKTYIVKNSWGQGWGENGYIRLLRTDDEESNCATDHSPKDGVACEGGPSKVEVCGTCGILYDNVVPNYQKRK